jgi:hypothetical protein
MMSMHTIPPLYKLAMAGSVEEGISPRAHRGSDNGPTEGRRKGGPIDFPGNFLANQSFRLWSSQPIPPTGHDEVGAEPPEPARGWRASLNALPLLAPPLCSGLGAGPRCDFAIVPRRFYQKNARRRLAAWCRRNETNARTAFPSANPTDRPTANVISTEGVIAP